MTLFTETEINMDIKVGQIWRDKDKRRNTVIEIVAVADDKRGDAEVIGKVVGTEETRSYREDRLVKRWEKIEDVGDPHEVEEDLKPAPEIDLTELKPKHKTREQWLEAAVKALKKAVFRDLSYEKKGEPEPVSVVIPDVRVSVGWPGGRGPKAAVIGQCWKSHTAADKVIQVFISPVVDDPLKALGTLTHELIHASDDGASGHRSHFAKVARLVGFVPKYTGVNMGDELKESLQALIPALGAYPHSAIRVEDRPKVQKTYQLKAVCVYDDEYKVRLTQKMADDWGMPLCPCHEESMEFE